MSVRNSSFHADHQPEGQSTFTLFDVDKIQRDPAANGRFEGHDEIEVRDLALDILSKSQPGAGNRPFYHGQIHGVVLEKDENGVPVLVAGYGRVNAIDWINANVSDPDVRVHLERLNLLDDAGNLAKPFPVKATIAPKMNAQDRVLFNVGENARRKPLSPMDWAVVIQKFAQQGLTDAQIVALLVTYRPTGKGEIHPTWIQQHRALLMLSPDLQRRVHNYEIPVHRAGEIYRNAKEMTSEDGSKLTGPDLHAEMDRQIKEVIKDDGTVDGAKLRANNRVQNAKRGAASTMTIAELKKLLNESIAKTGSTVAKKFLAIVESKITLEAAYSFLADFGPEDFAPEGSDKPKTGKGKGSKGKDKPAPVAAAEPAKRGRKPKIGVEAPAPVTGGAAPVSPITGEAPALPEGVRLPPKRANGGRTRRNVEPVAAEQTEISLEDAAPAAEMIDASADDSQSESDAA